MVHDIDAERRAARLRNLIAARRAVLLPGAANALAARLIEDQGFDALYLSGAGIANSHLGLPDLGFVGLETLVDHTAAIREISTLPLVVDADTGFGNALSVRQTVRRLARAGADAIQIEDQAWPKRCGHFDGKRLVDVEEMAAKIEAAIEARGDQGPLIIARTDARAGEGFEAAIARANRYAAAGADVIFLEAPESEAELKRLPALISAPLMVNMVVGGKTPILDRAVLERWGIALVLYANTALQAAVRGMQQALAVLAANGRMDEDPALVAPFAERQRLVGKPGFDALDARYGRAGRPAED